MRTELSLMEFVEENATAEELERYRSLIAYKAPATLWYFGIEAFRESHPKYCERYVIEQTFGDILRDQIASRKRTAQGRLNGAMNWTDIDLGLWPEVRINPAENTVHVGVQVFGGVRLHLGYPTTLHEKMVQIFETFAQIRSPEDTAQPDFFAEVDEQLGPGVSRPAKQAAWKAARLAEEWRRGGARSAAARRLR